MKQNEFFKYVCFSVMLRYYGKPPHCKIKSQKFGCQFPNDADKSPLYLKVECINLRETNFSSTAESQRLWQGAICHVWTSQFNRHWRKSQKQLQKYNITDKKLSGSFDVDHVIS